MIRKLITLSLALCLADSGFIIAEEQQNWDRIFIDRINQQLMNASNSCACQRRAMLLFQPVWSPYQEHADDISCEQTTASNMPTRLKLILAQQDVDLDEGFREQLTRGWVASMRAEAFQICEAVNFQEGEVIHTYLHIYEISGLRSPSRSAKRYLSFQTQWSH